MIAQSCCKKRHDAVAQIVHWELAKRSGFDIVENWWDHHPMSVMQNSSMKLLWDFTIQTDKHLSHNHPDIVCADFIKNHCFLIDVAIPGDNHLSNKVTEKLERYTDLKLEIQKVVSESFCGACSNWFTWLYPYTFKENFATYIYLLPLFHFQVTTECVTVLLSYVMPFCD